MTQVFRPPIEALRPGDLLRVPVEHNSVWAGIGEFIEILENDRESVRLRMIKLDDPEQFVELSELSNGGEPTGGFIYENLEFLYASGTCPRCEINVILKGDYLCQECRYGG